MATNKTNLTQSKIDALLRSTGSSAVGQILAARGHRARNGAFSKTLEAYGYAYLSGLMSARTGRDLSGLVVRQRMGDATWEIMTTVYGWARADYANAN